LGSPLAARLGYARGMSGLREDLTQLAIVHTDELAWQPSPSPTVWRKRLELRGDVERGRVTSVVRYDPASSFPAQNHPEGEEFLVLSGTLSDEQGDFPAGTSVLNPPGFQHGPRSSNGCVAFVKLRQYAGADRPRVVVDTRQATWEPHAAAGVATLALYAQPGYPETVALVRARAGAALEQRFPGGGEIFVIAGGFADEHGTYRTGSWARYPAGSRHRAVFSADSELYLKTGHLAPA
jgi:anti-sigma factor ChrR (cupin superfamily)